jgi:hypothetical protein
MRSPTIRRRTVIIAGGKTSVSIEDEFWKSFRRIAHGRDQTLCGLIADINENRQSPNLSSPSAYLSFNIIATNSLGEAVIWELIWAGASDLRLPFVSEMLRLDQLRMATSCRF